jgi:Uma2 family endonuclease
MESAMNIRTTPLMDKASFWAWLEHQPRRHELVDGVPRMLPNVAMNHARICGRVAMSLMRQLDASKVDVTQADFAVETGRNTIRYADVMVCNRLDDGSARSTSDALLLVEVLSPSSVHVDFGPKLVEYTALPSLSAYLILAQDRISAWLWAREPDGTWPEHPTVVENPEGTVQIDGLAITIAMAEIYTGVDFR